MVKNTPKNGNFGHNSKTNQDIEHQNSSLTSPINSKDNDI